MIYVIVGLALFVVFVLYPCAAISSAGSREEEREWK